MLWLTLRLEWRGLFVFPLNVLLVAEFTVVDALEQLVLGASSPGAAYHGMVIMIANTSMISALLGRLIL